MPRTSPSCRCLSNSSLVFSSSARMSSIVRPCHWSIQQNTCLQSSTEMSKQTQKNWVNKAKPVERGEEPTLWLLNKVLDATLQPEPLKFACDKFVARHHRLHLLSPVRPNQRTSASFWRLEPLEGRKMLAFTSSSMRQWWCKNSVESNQTTWITEINALTQKWCNS